MAVYGLTSQNFEAQSGRDGLDISNNNHDTGLQNGWSTTSQYSLGAGFYLLCACYQTSMDSGEFPNSDEDPFEMSYTINGSVQSSSLRGLESAPQTHIRSSGVKIWPHQSSSAFTCRFCVRKGFTDADSGGTRGRLHWTIIRVQDYE